MLGFEGENAREKVIVLLTMCFALAMAMLDNTVVNVALPTISRELGAGVSELQWIVDGYVLAFASLLLTGGIAGDRYGGARRSSSPASRSSRARLAALRPVADQRQLIAARASRASGRPCSCRARCRSSPSRSRRTSAPRRSACGPACRPRAGAGPDARRLDGRAPRLGVGVLPQPADRRRGHLFGPAHVRESRSEVTRGLDIPGTDPRQRRCLAATYGLIEANVGRWGDPVILISLTSSAVLLLLFLGWEVATPTR